MALEEEVKQDDFDYIPILDSPKFDYSVRVMYHRTMV